MRNGMKWMMLGSLGLALGSGCGAAVEPEQAGPAHMGQIAKETTEADVVLRIELESGHDVTFYEPAPGGLFLVERMMPGQSFVLGPKELSNALLAFEALRPGEVVPQEIQEASARAIILPGAPAGSGVVVPQAPQGVHESAIILPGAPAGSGFKAGGGQSEASAQTPGVARQALTSSSSAFVFVTDNGGCNWGPEWSFCRVNWSNGFFASAGGTTSGLCVVDHYAGNGVTIQSTVGSTITSSFQGAGTIAQYSLGVAGAATTRRIDVTNASGDSFHAGCRWGI